MHPTHFASRFVCLVFVTVCGVRTAFADDVATATEVPSLIRDELNKVISASPPPALLRRLSGKVQSGSTSGQLEQYFERLDSGLWGVTTAHLVRGALVRTMLTLNGLVELSATSTIDRDFRVDSVIPIGKLFTSFGVDKNVKANGVITITSLAGDLKAIAEPVAGGRFSYSRTASGQNTITTTGVFGGTRTSTLNVKFKADCSIGAESQASTLHLQLRGKYLPVKCENDLNGSNGTSEYAYFVDSHLYVLLSSQKDKFSIESVEYVQ